MTDTLSIHGVLRSRGTRGRPESVRVSSPIPTTGLQERIIPTVVVDLLDVDRHRRVKRGVAGTGHELVVVIIIDQGPIVGFYADVDPLTLGHSSRLAEGGWRPTSVRIRSRRPLCVLLAPRALVAITRLVTSATEELGDPASGGGGRGGGRRRWEARLMFGMTVVVVVVVDVIVDTRLRLGRAFSTKPRHISRKDRAVVGEIVLLLHASSIRSLGHSFVYPSGGMTGRWDDPGGLCIHVPGGDPEQASFGLSTTTTTNVANTTSRQGMTLTRTYPPCRSEIGSLLTLVILVVLMMMMLLSLRLHHGFSY
jgi:hypothetical protein